MKRWRDPRIQPLEIWDAIVDGRTIFDWQRQPDQMTHVLATLIGQLERGEATFAEARPSPARFPRIDRVYALGGGVLSTPMLRALPERGYPIAVASDPVFAAALAGSGLASRPVVADVGQTAIKVVFGGTRVHEARDFEELPIISNADAGARTKLRPRFVAFVAHALREAIGETNPDTVVLALPCTLDDDLVADECSYPYPGPDPALVRDILAAAGLTSVPALVLNDAELAAYAAAQDNQLPAAGTTLVLTLGFGVGAALLRAPA